MDRLPVLHRLSALLTCTALTVLLVLQPAFANVCRSIEAELASMARGPTARERQQADRAAQEASRLAYHMRSIGCDNRAFLIFGKPPPPECAGYRGQLAQLQAQSQAAYGVNEPRRSQLMSMLVSYDCRPSPQRPAATARRSDPLTAGLYDNGARRWELDSERDLGTRDVEIPAIDAPAIESRIRGRGGKAYCVRTCDGYYFPMTSRPASTGEDGDEACQALCPAAETKIYYTPRDIENARSSEGIPYTDLDTAFRYRKTFDATCQCRQAGAPYASGSHSVLNPEGRQNGSGFDQLNPDLQPEEAAPLRGLKPVPGNAASKKTSATLFGNRPPPEPPAPPQPPPDIPADKMVSAGQGEIREVQSKDGTKRIVRVIAPELSNAPSEAKAPSVPGRDRSP